MQVYKCWKVGCGVTVTLCCLMSHEGWQILGLSFGIADKLINTWDGVKEVAYGI